ncbi:NmrA family NAD(P)-binding protein [Streptomonospora algeriensis]|uniref:NmrA family NAD(P)-binding protein n=1 Tax=Streptomonospora algeriensis TaxID=995084 RepID=A0ABW3BAR1_9ACTN
MTGATGTIGGALAAELFRLGRTARLLVRPGAADRVSSLGEPAEADLDDGPALGRALAGVRALMLVTPLSPRQDRRQIRLIEAAVDAGVERIVKISALGADPASPVGVHAEHGRSDAVLAASGVSYAILRPNTFMQNVAQWRTAIERTGTLELPMGEARVSMVDARDVASAARGALLEWERVNGAFDLTGPEALSYDRIAELISEATGTRVRYTDAAPETAAANMRAGGAPEWAVQARLELYRSIRAGEAAVTTSHVAELAGRAPCRLADFLNRTRLLRG